MNPADLLFQAQQDLAEVQDQRASGELDDPTAIRLTDTYEAEIARLQGPADHLAQADTSSRSRNRLLVGAVILTAAFAGITWAASGALVGREPDAFSGPDRQVDLATISNEQMIEVIDANPDLPEVNRMRLALAERYFEAGEYSGALTWFQTVLDSGPAPAEESEALARIGWMILESGEPDTALRFEDLALEANPSNLEANYFRGLAYARLGRTDEALADLRLVADSPDLPDDVRSVVTNAIAALEDGT